MSRSDKFSVFRNVFSRTGKIPAKWFIPIKKDAKKSNFFRAQVKHQQNEHIFFVEFLTSKNMCNIGFPLGFPFKINFAVYSTLIRWFTRISCKLGSKSLRSYQIHHNAMFYSNKAIIRQKNSLMKENCFEKKSKIDKNEIFKVALFASWQKYN